MGDSGEGLIDAEARIQERREELERERAPKGGRVVPNPELQRLIESLRLARTELERQMRVATNPRRKAQLTQAMEEIDHRMSETRSRMTP